MIADAPLGADGRSFTVMAAATAGTIYYAELFTNPNDGTGGEATGTGNSPDVQFTGAP